MESRFGRWRNLFFYISFALTCLIMQTLGESAVITKDTEDDDSWCYYCMSPRTNIVKQKIREEAIYKWSQYLRRLPVHEIQECGQFTNSTSLPKQKCPSRFCFKHMTDDKDGTPFVIRLCSDQFATSDKSNLKETCSVDHKEWTIANCFCKGNLCNESFKFSSSFPMCIVFFVFLNIVYSVACN